MTADIALGQLARNGQLDQTGVATLLGADQRLIVYGSLVPGGANHHVVSKLGGTWHAGWITGQLLETGWGAAMGYPALKWDPKGDRVPAHLLDSSKLIDHWPELDEFEGEEYRRILIPFFEDEAHRVIGQVYVARSTLEA